MLAIPKHSGEPVQHVQDELCVAGRLRMILGEIEVERRDRNVPTAMLWGRVCEYFYISPADLSEMLARLGARK